MNQQSIRDYILRQQQRYHKANRTEKGRILDEVVGGNGLSPQVGGAPALRAEPWGWRCACGQTGGVWPQGGGSGQADP